MDRQRYGLWWRRLDFALHRHPRGHQREFNDGLWEVVLTPRETIKLPQKTQLAQEDDR